MNYIIFNQFKQFFITSGIGWLIDFSIYSIITIILGIDVLYANIMSSIPAITFVFFVSTRKTFSNRSKNISLKLKYMIYVIYQLILLLFISSLSQWLFSIFLTISWINAIFGIYIKIITKIIITPITMSINFLVMKGVIEKL